MAVAKGKKERIRRGEEDKVSILLEDLASLESYARDLFSFLPLPVCLISAIGIILDANPSFEELSGYRLEEIIGKPAEEVFDKGRLGEISKQTLEKGFVRAEELSIFTKNKKEILGSASATLRKTEEGEIVGYFLGFFNLAGIKKREKELRETQVALANILEDVEEARAKAEEEKNKTGAIIINLTDGILVFGEEDKLSLMNPLAEKFFDIKARDLIDRPISELSTFPTLKPLIKVLTEEVGEIFRKEVSLKKDLTLEMSAVPVLRKKERIGNLIILHDITREKLVEKMKTEFVSLAAHQLRTPLSAIKWTLKMLLDGDLGKITEEQRDFITKTYQSNERMITLINNLLDITRIEEGRYIYKPALTEFEPIVQFVVDSCKGEAERKKIKIEFRKPKKKSRRAMLDIEKIRLAVENLLDNAIKYTQAGGRVIVSLKNTPKEIELSVKDSGVGIPKDQQGRVFAKFFRGANVIRMATEGTGLGLFITKNIIEAHGGRIWFESEEGKGTTFYLALPIKEEFEGFLREF
ncbi:hypothetical protein AMJ48_02255 [Parcubacteria bacterium DG_74_1]|nr:MAG: hypothetical protein AMJ48_02255 [Parcubacteria bacterium DG_74_1]